MMGIFGFKGISYIELISNNLGIYILRGNSHSHVHVKTGPNISFFFSPKEEETESISGDGSSKEGHDMSVKYTNVF